MIGCFFAFLTAINGHSTAQYLHEYQPEKLADAEGLFETQSHAPLAIGGFTDREAQEVKWGIEIPWALSFLAGNSFDTVVVGLNDFPEELWPPLFIHTLFNAMVGIGSLLILIPILVFAWRKILKKKHYPNIMLWTLVTTGPLAVLAIELLFISVGFFLIVGIELYAPSPFQKGVNGMPRLSVIAVTIQYLIASYVYGKAHLPYIIYPNVTIHSAFTDLNSFRAVFITYIIGFALLFPGFIYFWSIFMNDKRYLRPKQ